MFLALILKILPRCIVYVNSIKCNEGFVSIRGKLILTKHMLMVSKILNIEYECLKK